jgi:hypothetical protein
MTSQNSLLRQVLHSLIMKLELFQEVVINRDFPEYKIAKGDIAILNDYVIDPIRTEACVLEKD